MLDRGVGMTPTEILNHARRLAGQHRGDWPLSFDERVSAACYGALTARPGTERTRMRGQIIDEIRAHPNGEVRHPPEWFDLIPRGPEPDAFEARDEVEHALSLISERDAAMLWLHLGYGETQREVGRMHGVCHERVSQIVALNTRRLRARLGRE